MNFFDISSDFKVNKKSWRLADQKFYVSDTSKIYSVSGWTPETNLDNGLENFSYWIKNYAKFNN